MKRTFDLVMLSLIFAVFTAVLLSNPPSTSVTYYSEPLMFVYDSSASLDPISITWSDKLSRPRTIPVRPGYIPTINPKHVANGRYPEGLDHLLAKSWAVRSGRISDSGTFVPDGTFTVTILPCDTCPGSSGTTVFAASVNEPGPLPDEVTSWLYFVEVPK